MIHKVGLIYKGNEKQIPLLVLLFSKPNAKLTYVDDSFCSAYELYADPKSDRKDYENVDTSLFQRLKQALGFPLEQAPTQEPPAQRLSMAERFKQTFSRSNVTVHFLGVWYAIHSTTL
ncbi:hypothetical protein MD484_g8998, partial [Candolleomyces efflorescens]